MVNKTVLRLLDGSEITRNTPESAIQADGIIIVSNAFMRDLTIWRNNSGVDNSEGRFIKYGISGQGDVSGIMCPGTRIEIEFKRLGKDQTRAQSVFQYMIESFGGLYLLCDGDYENQLIRPIRERIERDRRIVR